jgi:hypothetical protein
MARAFRFCRAIVFATFLAGATATGAQGKINWDRIDLAQERGAIEQFQAYDQRLQNIGWKLVRANAEFCDKVVPSIGLQLQDMASYGSPEVARRALGLSGDFAVQTAAQGSPAALSGEYAANREITTIAGTNPNVWSAERRFEWQRLTRAHNLIDASLKEHDAIEIVFADGSKTVTAPVPVCASRFELMGEGKKAIADGNRVVIGIEFPAFQYEDDELAGLIAHELAHNLLGHTAWLGRNKRKRRHVRLTEREADRLIPWLLANAGYDPRGGKRFFEKWGPRNDGWIFRARTHDGWDERAEFVEAEIPTIEALMEEHGKADWRAHFRREIDPDKGIESEQR